MNIIDLDSILILKKIENSPKNKGKILSHLEIDNFQETMTSLIENKLAVLNEPDYSITPDGKQSLINYDNLGIPETYKQATYPLAILKFLNLISKPIKYDLFPETIKKAAPSTSSGYGDGYALMHYIEFSGSLKPYIDIKGGHGYIINETGRTYYGHLLEEQNKKLKENIAASLHIGDNIHNTTHGEESHIIGRDYVQELKQKDNLISGLDEKLKAAQIDLTNEQTKLTTLQSKELRNKTKFAIIGFIAGGVLTNAKDIWHIVKSLLHI